MFENLRKGPVAATAEFRLDVDEQGAFLNNWQVMGHKFWCSTADTAIFWRMRLRPSMPETARVRYIQELLGKQARFILCTLRCWPVPAGVAGFVVS